MRPHECKSQSKPIVSSRLPKAFSQPTKVQHKEEQKEPLQLTQDQHLNIKRALKKLRNIPLPVNTAQSLDTVTKLQQNSPDFLVVTQAKLEDVVTLRILTNSVQSGVTRKVLHALTLKLLVVRQLPVNTRESRQHLVEWLGRWQQLQRKNLQLLPVSSTNWNSPEGCVSVILDYMNAGSLSKLIECVGSLPESVLADVTCQALRAVGYLHKKGIAHGQLTASQLLLDRDGVLKLAPGLGARLKGEAASCTFEDDIYALGHILLTAVCGGAEWLDSSLPAECCIYHSLVQAHAAPPLIRVSTLLRDFLCKCLRTDPTQRLPIDQLLQHPWPVQDSYPGPAIRLRELLTMTSSWEKADVTEVGESELSRICKALSVVLVEKRPSAPAENWAEDLATDLGLSREAVEVKVRGLLADLQ